MTSAFGNVRTFISDRIVSRRNSASSRRQLFTSTSHNSASLDRHFDSMGEDSSESPEQSDRARARSGEPDEFLSPKRAFLKKSFSFSASNRRHSSSTMDGFLSSKERRLIKKSWTKIGDVEELGKRTYKHIFILEPNILKLFPFGHLSPEDLDQSPDFVHQASQFMRFFSGTVGMVGSNDYGRLRGACIQSGRVHASMTVVDFQPEWWSLFRTSFISCIQPYCRAAQPTLDAWKKLLDRIVSDMEIGFKERKREQEIAKLALKNGEITETEAEKVKEDRDALRQVSSDLKAISEEAIGET